MKKAANEEYYIYTPKKRYTFKSRDEMYAFALKRGLAREYESGKFEWNDGCGFGYLFEMKVTNEVD